MSEAHCRKFPDCWEIGENKREPKCDHPDCPGNRTWADVIAPPPVVHSYDEERHYSERLRDWAHDWNQPVEPLAGAMSLKTTDELRDLAVFYYDEMVKALARVAELERERDKWRESAEELSQQLNSWILAHRDARAAGIEEAARELPKIWMHPQAEWLASKLRELKDQPDAETK